MHGYLRAIGFKSIMTKKALTELLYDVLESPDEQKQVNFDNKENIVEIRKQYANGVGILLHGYYDEKDHFQMEYYIPYIKGNCDPIDEDISITRHLHRESFAGACEDIRLGVALIYYLENGIEYVETVTRSRHSSFHTNIRLGALSCSGMILLPVNKTQNQLEKSRIASQNRRQLITAAQAGDENAIENLTIEDLDTYTRINRRIRNEDVLTIVDTSFMPYGVECDQYSILSNILDVKSYINRYSGELIYILTVDCNEFHMNVVINREDLIGEPSVGMRFKGSIWLQATVDFTGLTIS